MAKGNAVKRDHIKVPDTLKPDEVDTLSSIDQGKDFIKTGEK